MKKILSVLLAVLMMFSVCSFAFAADEKETIVVVSGMGCFPLYEVNDDGTQTQVWAPNTEIIKNTVLSSLKGTVSEGSLVDSILTALKEEMFCYIECDNNGDSVKNVTCPKFSLSVDNYPETFENSENTEDEIGITKSMISEFGGENVYFFNYDWRLNPLKHADDLDEFVQSVKEQSGASKVTLVPCSMGGEVVDAYLYKHGSDDVKKIIYCMVASKGLDMVGELFGKKISITTDMLLERLFSFEMDQVVLQILISAVQNGVKVTNLDVPLDKLVKQVVDGINEKAYSELLVDTFATDMSLWGFVDDSCYEEDKDIMFDGNIDPTFEANIDEYHYNVLNKAEELIQSAKDDGTDVYIIASYGYVGIPVTDYAWEQTDCLIETNKESFGATTANYGESLGSDYVAKGTVCSDLSHNHVSTDGAVDASTCAFPETTWFIKNNRHVGLNCETDCGAFVQYLAATDGATVQSNENYPQFIELNPITGRFSSLTGNEITQSSMWENAFSRLIYIFKAIIDTIRSYFGI